MRQWIISLDRLLRGQTTRLADLGAGTIEIPVTGFVVVIWLLGMIYGGCMGLFSLTPGGSGHPMQLLASTVKLPLLFLLTLLVTFPSLYVFNALVGSQLLAMQVLRLLIAALAVMLATLASIGPIVGFFSFSTTSYSFMIVLNVVVFSVAGLLGLAFLLQTLRRMTLAMRSAASPPPPDGAEEARQTPLDGTGEQFLAPHVNTIFRIWVAVFGLVGAQMAWVLRPFIGNPQQPFTWFRRPYSNFFEAVIVALRHLAN